MLAKIWIFCWAKNGVREVGNWGVREVGFRDVGKTIKNGS